MRLEIERVLLNPSDPMFLSLKNMIRDILTGFKSETNSGKSDMDAWA